ncbi:MAG: amino acid permease [Acidimicrobiia bacterium]|nr:amino acid permease [Acidimicrobiia bacterium]
MAIDDSSSQSRTLEGSENFERVLSLPQVTASGVAIIIGAGIYVLLGPAAEDAGAQVWMSFLFASALSVLTAFSYMELSSMFPKAGSEQEFARHAFPSWVSATVGWSMALALVVAASTVALGFSRYLAEFIEVDSRVSAIAIALVTCFVSFLGMQRAIWLVLTLGAIEVGGLVLVFVVGAPDIGDVDLFSGFNFGGVFASASLVFFAFIGFDEVITLSEETKNPRRTVPLALLLSLAISTLLYVGVAIVAVSVLGVDGLVNSTRPLADVMSLRVGASSAKLMAAIALVSTSSTVLLASTGVAIGLILLEDISLLAGATDVLIYILFVIVNLVLIILRKRMPNHPRQFVVRGSIRGVPILPVLGIIATLSMGFNVKRDASLLAIFIVVVGIAIALLGSRKSVTYRYE